MTKIKLAIGTLAGCNAMGVSVPLDVTSIPMQRAMEIRDNGGPGLKRDGYGVCLMSKYNTIDNPDIGRKYKKDAIFVKCERCYSSMMITP